MNKLFATIVVLASLVAAGSSAHAGVYSMFADKAYMQCIRGTSIFARNAAERDKAVRICNKRHGYPYQ